MPARLVASCRTIHGAYCVILHSIHEHDPLEELKALSNIIQESIGAIETAMKANSMTFPSPHSSFTIDSEAPRKLPEVEQACALLASAAGQLVCSVRSPMHTVVSAALQVGMRLRIRVIN